MLKQNKILFLIVFCQFCCTSLWFAGNSIATDLIEVFSLSADFLSTLTSVVQLGFIVGTLLFAFLNISDRFEATHVFFVCALVGSILNAFLLFDFNTVRTLLAIRFFVGVSLAGIYPVGIKIAASHFSKGLGKYLGFLVGALVLGTAFPHMLNGFALGVSWKLVLVLTSLISLLGGFLILCVPTVKVTAPLSRIDIRLLFNVFRKKAFRNAAYGYFGHMWELYTFWAFVPSMLMLYQQRHDYLFTNLSLLSFAIIGIGALSCVWGGFLSLSFGLRKTAFYTLLMSACCCLLFPLFCLYASPAIYVLFLFFWSAVVIADSPLFSSLLAQSSLAKERGTALTIVNCIGFSITILSIYSITYLQAYMHLWSFMFLAIGPFFGLYFLTQKKV